MWFLNTGCSNHMSGDKLVFSTLDESFKDNVMFENNFRVMAMGKDKFQFKSKEILLTL